VSVRANKFAVTSSFDDCHIGRAFYVVGRGRLETEITSWIPAKGIFAVVFLCRDELNKEGPCDRLTPPPPPTIPAKCRESQFGNLTYVRRPGFSVKCEQRRRKSSLITDLTERHDRVVNTPSSYSRGPGLKSRHGDRLT
jgi:hypothetical protein